ncbi:MAG: GFA family protein [Steroidobacteraceae bacterium]
MSERHLGGCLCGAVRYQVDGPLRPVINCHCGMCRRFHGHFGAYTAASRGDLSWSGSGEPSGSQSSPRAKRGFCPRCGSSLFWQEKDSGKISIAAGSLDEPTGLRAAAHIYVAHKGDYYDIEDQLPRWQYSSSS